MQRRLWWALLAVACVAAGPVLAEDGPMCADCHDEVVAGMTHQIHMRIQPFEVQGRAVGCEGCHGDGVAHAEEGDPSSIRTFASLDDLAMMIHAPARRDAPIPPVGPSRAPPPLPPFRRRED